MRKWINSTKTNKIGFQKGEKMATTITIWIQLTNGLFAPWVPIIKLDGTRYYGERGEDAETN